MRSIPASLRLLAAGLSLTALTTLAWALAPPAKRSAPVEDSTPKSIVHGVYFSLADATAENRQKLIDGCDKYLSKHPGTIYYSAGALSDIAGMYNDRDFDVGLTLVFENREAYDKYHASEDHDKFIAECRPLMSKVRVFDAAGSK